jgi:Tfp pilus assembly protein PilX
MMNKYSQPWQCNLRNCERGMALVLVLVFTGLLLTIGSALLTFAFNEKQIALYQTQDIRQFYLAEAGIEIALAALNDNFYARDPFSAELDDGLLSITYEETAINCLLVHSSGSVNGGKTTLTVAVEHSDDVGVYITEWIK